MSFGARVLNHPVVSGVDVDVGDECHNSAGFRSLFPNPCVLTIHCHPPTTFDAV
jgi:hypothetical protein